MQIQVRTVLALSLAINSASASRWIWPSAPPATTPAEAAQIEAQVKVSPAKDAIVVEQADVTMKDGKGPIAQTEGGSWTDIFFGFFGYSSQPAKVSKANAPSLPEQSNTLELADGASESKQDGMKLDVEASGSTYVEEQSDYSSSASETKTSKETGVPNSLFCKSLKRHYKAQSPVNGGSNDPTPPYTLGRDEDYLDESPLTDPNDYSPPESPIFEYDDNIFSESDSDASSTDDHQSGGEDTSKDKQKDDYVDVVDLRPLFRDQQNHLLMESFCLDKLYAEDTEEPRSKPLQLKKTSCKTPKRSNRRKRRHPRKSRRVPTNTKE